MAKIKNVPYIGESESNLYNILRMYYPEMGLDYKDIELMEDYPLGDDYTYLRHYVRGAGSPLVDFCVYVDVGVGWKLKPTGFSNDKEGEEAHRIAEEFLDKIDFYTTMTQFAAYREILGRGCIVKTYDVNGEFYFDEKTRVTGIDNIDPLTLDYDSIRKVSADRTGKEMYIQRPSGWNPVNQEEIKLDQSRVIYRARNNLNKYSPDGISLFQNCLTDLRTVAKFPRYRADISRKYSNIHRHFKVNTELLLQTPEGNEILSDQARAKAYLDDIHELVVEQEKKAASIATFDFIDSQEQSYGGKEPDIYAVEKATLESIGLKTGLPIELLMHGGTVNRATLDTLSDLFLKRRENGARRQVYSPIIQSVATEYIRMNGYGKGTFTVEYNPFMTKDLNSIVNRMVALKSVQAISTPEIRREIDLPDKVMLGESEEYTEKKIQGVVNAGMVAPGSMGAPPKNEKGEKPYQMRPNPIPYEEKAPKKPEEYTLEQALINGDRIRPLYLDKDV